MVFTIHRLTYPTHLALYLLRSPYRIAHLTEHVKKNRKDYTTTRALTQLVRKRRALLDYLYDRDINRYRAIIKALGLRK